VTFNSNLFPACLWIDPNEEQLIVGKPAILASAFGKTSSGYTLTPDRIGPMVQLKTRLEVYALDACNQSYIDGTKIRQLPNYIQPSQLCAAIPANFNETCQCDSGGPLQTIVGEQHHIVGITSFGFSCGSQLSSVYTRVSFYLDWIESIVWP
jgi:secreted trypsin-like serine protease